MADIDKTTWAEVEAAIKAGRKIEAVRLYREAVPGIALMDAKKAVEDTEAQLRRQHPEDFGPPTSKSGCLGMVVVMAGLAGSLMLRAAGVVGHN